MNPTSYSSRAHYNRRTRERWHGPADLAVEAQSESTARYVLREKFRDYEQSGVREFWILDTRPGHQSLRAFALTGGGAYQELPLDANGRFHSIVLPGLWLDPSWFWQDPLPKAHELMIEIAPDAFGR